MSRLVYRLFFVRESTGQRPFLCLRSRPATWVRQDECTLHAWNRHGEIAIRSKGVSEFDALYRNEMPGEIRKGKTLLRCSKNAQETNWSFSSPFRSFERTFCDSSKTEDQLQFLAELPKEKQEEIFQPLIEFLDADCSFYNCSNVNNNNIDNDKELLEKWFSPSSPDPISMEESEIKADTIADSIENAIQQAIASQSLKQSNSKRPLEGPMEDLKEGLKKGLDPLDLPLTDADSINEVEDDIQRWLDDVNLGLPVEETTEDSNSSTSDSKASDSDSTARGSNDDDKSRGFLKKWFSNQNSKRGAKDLRPTLFQADLEESEKGFNESKNSTSLASADQSVGTESSTESLSELGTAFRDARDALALIHFAVEDALEAQRRLEGLVADSKASWENQNAAKGGNTAAHNKSALAAAEA